MARSYLKMSLKRTSYQRSTAWLLTNAMEDVVTIGTGKQLKLQAIDMPVAGKTGSTSDYNDLWFSGYTPYYTASVWGGFDHIELSQNVPILVQFGVLLWKEFILKKVWRKRLLPCPIQ